MNGCLVRGRGERLRLFRTRLIAACFDPPKGSLSTSELKTPDTFRHGQEKLLGEWRINNERKWLCFDEQKLSTGRRIFWPFLGRGPQPIGSTTRKRRRHRLGGVRAFLHHIPRLANSFLSHSLIPQHRLISNKRLRRSASCFFG